MGLFSRPARSNNTHRICRSCWDKRYNGAYPLVVPEQHRRNETCCFCGTTTGEGIYVSNVNARDVRQFCECTADVIVHN
jgi:hypothetical protein